VEFLVCKWERNLRRKKRPLVKKRKKIQTRRKEKSCKKKGRCLLVRNTHLRYVQPEREWRALLRCNTTEGGERSPGGNQEEIIASLGGEGARLTSSKKETVPVKVNSGKGEGIVQTKEKTTFYPRGSKDCAQKSLVDGRGEKIYPEKEELQEASFLSRGGGVLALARRGIKMRKGSQRKKNSVSIFKGFSPRRRVKGFVDGNVETIEKKKKKKGGLGGGICSKGYLWQGRGYLRGTGVVI